MKRIFFLLVLSLGLFSCEKQVIEPGVYQPPVPTNPTFVPPSAVAESLNTPHAYIVGAISLFADKWIIFTAAYDAGKNSCDAEMKETLENINYCVGRGYFNAHRFNPYNPLSYIALIIILIVGILMFGFYGFWKETTTLNPFRWD